MENLNGKYINNSKITLREKIDIFRREKEKKTEMKINWTISLSRNFRINMFILSSLVIGINEDCEINFKLHFFPPTEWKFWRPGL